MIDIVEGIKFLSPFYHIEYTVHKVTDNIVEVTGEGELVQYTRKEFDQLNKKSDLKEIKQ